MFLLKAILLEIESISFSFYICSVGLTLSSAFLSRQTADHMNHLSIDWEDIIDNIKNEKTIVFLGPNTYLSNDDHPLEELMLKTLGVHDPDHPYIKTYYEDGFFLFREKKYRRRIIRQMKEFYTKQFEEQEAFLTKLARIPFHIYIGMTPDHMLGRAFGELNLNSSQDHYNMGKAPGPYTAPRKNQPLIYNMLGSINSNQSIVLTHNDLFDYLKSIFVGKSMPLGLKEELFNAVQYIFLGLPFEKWYLQLLLRILSLHTRELEHLERLATKPRFELKKNIFKEQFRIEFIADEAESFLHQLYAKCEESGILRDVNEDKALNPKVSIEDIYNIIAKGENQKALNSMMGLIKLYLPKTEELRKDLLVLMNDYQNIEKQFLQGTDGPYTGKERNRIIAAFLDLIDRFRAFV